MGVHCDSPGEKSQTLELGYWRGDREEKTNSEDPVQQAFDIHKGFALANPQPAEDGSVYRKAWLSPT